MKRFLISFVLGNLLTALCAASAGAQQTPSAPDCAELPAVKARLEQSESRLRDWAGLGRYREANSRLATPPRSERRVVFIGDSITDWWDDAERGNKFFPGKPYVNRGIGGQTTPQMLIRFYPDVIALRPKAVVILAGTNDLSGDSSPARIEQIQNNLSAMAQLARAHDIRVVFASLLPIHDAGHDTAGKPIKRTERRPPEMIRALNAWMRTYAASNKHTYLDYHSALVDDRGMLRTELSEDGLHVNPKGYAIMLPLAEAAVASALKR